MANEWTSIEPLFDGPAVDSPSYLAHKLMSAKDGTPRMILATVSTGPKQFKELQKATGKPDGQITRALSTLHDEGILVERLHAREAPAFKTHELGTKGILVLSMMKAFHDAEKSVEVKPIQSITYVMTRGPMASPVAHRAKKVGTRLAHRKASKTQADRKSSKTTSKRRTHAQA